ncbi:MAG: helix-turn-helix domain-containing protein [Opitutaceae bacterium]
MKTGEQSVIGVVFSSGFNDLSRFYRHFRQRFGAPPKTWARQYRG